MFSLLLFTVVVTDYNTDSMCWPTRNQWCNKLWLSNTVKIKVSLKSDYAKPMINNCVAVN